MTVNNELYGPHLTSSTEQLISLSDQLYLSFSSSSSSSEAFCPGRTMPVIVGVFLFSSSPTILGRHVFKEKESSATSFPLRCQKRLPPVPACAVHVGFCLSWTPGIFATPLGVFPLTLVHGVLCSEVYHFRQLI